jgi:hypothetical protein
LWLQGLESISFDVVSLNHVVEKADDGCVVLGGHQKKNVNLSTAPFGSELQNSWKNIHHRP